MTTEATRPSETSDPATVAVAALHVMSSGNRADYDPLIADGAVNRESIDEPLDTRGTGPAAFFATSTWLRTAFSDLTWQVNDVVCDGELVVIHATMSGRQTGPFVNYGPDGSVLATFPATDRRFAVTQSHWFRVKDGQVSEHWANRDDLGMGMQLGWGPPEAN